MWRVHTSGPTIRLCRGLRTYTGARNSSKSPFQVFVDTFKDEWRKDKELQSGIKALQDETGRLGESAAYKRAKEALEKAREGTSAASSVTGRSLRQAGRMVGGAAATAWDSPIGKSTREAVIKTVDTVDRVTEPVRKTAIYKDIKDVLDDGSSLRYGGFEEKEARRRRRAAAEARRLQQESSMPAEQRRVAADMAAGSQVVVHASAKSSTSSSSSSSTRPSVIAKNLAKLREAYEESDNAIISGLRSVTDKVKGLFDETESARVVRMFKEIDPTFHMDSFTRELREFIVPEMLDAYIKGDGSVLKTWLGEASFNIWSAQAKQYTEQGVFSAGRILDIRGVDILSSRVLPATDIPVFVVSARAQEIHIYKEAKTGKVVAGVEDRVQLSTYVLVLTRNAEDLSNAETRGWKVLELVRGQSRQWT